MLKKIKRIPGALVRRVKIIKEKMNGLDFTKSHNLEELGLPEDIAKLYAPSLKYDLNKVLKQLDIQPTDAILDYGSGKGSAMVIMSEFNFRLIGGVELSKQLADISKKNMSLLKLNNTEIFNCNASDFKEMDNYNHFYFFNPFPGSVLQDVLENIAESCQKNPRKVTLIYYCPRHRDVIENHPFFKESGGFKGKYWEILLYSNVF